MPDMVKLFHGFFIQELFIDKTLFLQANEPSAMLAQAFDWRSAE